MWGGKIFYFQPSFSVQIQSLVDYLHDLNANTDVHICLSLGYAPPLGAILCMNDIFYARPDRPKALESFANIQPQSDQMNTLRVSSVQEFTDEAFAGAVGNKGSMPMLFAGIKALITTRVVKMSTTVRADTSILEYAVETYQAAFEKLKGVKNLIFSITFEPLPVSLMGQSIARGGNALGLKPSDGPLVVVLFYSSWDSSSDDETIYTVNKEALVRIEKEAESRSVLASYLYMKYAFTHQDPIGSHGAESQAHLQAVSAKYDPEGFFLAAGAGPFKLSA
jgi:hypothetical protein